MTKIEIECQVVTSGRQDCPNKPGPARINNWLPDTIEIHIKGYGDHIVKLYLCDYHRYLVNNDYEGGY